MSHSCSFCGVNFDYNKDLQRHYKSDKHKQAETVTKKLNMQYEQKISDLKTKYERDISDLKQKIDDSNKELNCIRDNYKITCTRLTDLAQKAEEYRQIVEKAAICHTGTI